MIRKVIRRNSRQDIITGKLHRNGNTLKRITENDRLIKNALAALGSVSVIFISVICIAGLLASSPFGIFLSPESRMTSLREAVRNADISFLRQISAIRDGSSCGAYVICGHAAEWKDVLSVYAVKTSFSTDGTSGDLTMDSEKEQILSGIHSDMSMLSFSEQEISTADGLEMYLVINIDDLSAYEAAELYGFSGEQKMMLEEMLSFGEEYWEPVMGGYSAGMGTVPSSSTWTGTGMFGWPLSIDGAVTSRFGARTDPFTGEAAYHGGTDIAAPSGTPVLAAADGTVIVSNGSDSWGGGYGYHVMIDHGGGYVTVYGHCSFVCVTEGQQVRRGEMIAGVGTTGNSTGYHLHFEVRENGIKTDPLLWFTK